MRLLNVMQVSQKEIEENWNLKLPQSFYGCELFIRCNSKGKINWEVAPFYTKQELENRGDYQIIIVIDMEEVIKSEL